jgi:Cu/Ag efflux protein CusF
MIKTVVRSAGVVALVVAVLAIGQTARAASAEKGKQQEITGEISSVDAAANTVTIKHKSASMTFAVAKDAKFASGGQHVNLNVSNLKVGDRVTVHYTDEGGKKIAHRIGHVDISPQKATKDEKKAR